MYRKHFPHECHLTIWRSNREFFLCLSITYIYLNFSSTFTKSIVHSSCNSLPEVQQKDKPRSTRSWSGSTTCNQGTQILTFLGLTGKINSGFNIIFSVIICFPTALDNWGHSLPWKTCKTGNSCSSSKFKKFSCFFLWTICKPFTNSFKVGFLMFWLGFFWGVVLLFCCGFLVGVFFVAVFLFPVLYSLE